jgi:uncharacterized protein YbjQ (UPF0145 family)/phage FluMu protein Com
LAPRDLRHTFVSLMSADGVPIEEIARLDPASPASPALTCQHADMNQNFIEIPCPHCRITNESVDPGTGPWSCPNCGRTYILRRCSACGAVSHVSADQRRGVEWACVWCGEFNTGYKRREAEAPTFTDLAADVASRGLAFATPTGDPRSGELRDALPVLIVTTNDVAGYRITEVHGDVFGLIVRARNVFSNIGAQFMTVAGGEVAGYTKLLTDSRNQARERMWREARARGANAVVAMRFDCNEIGEIMSEVAAYGTAVTVEPLATTGTEVRPEAEHAQ